MTCRHSLLEFQRPRRLARRPLQEALSSHATLPTCFNRLLTFCQEDSCEYTCLTLRMSLIFKIARINFRAPVTAGLLMRSLSSTAGLSVRSSSRIIGICLRLLHARPISIDAQTFSSCEDSRMALLRQTCCGLLSRLQSLLSLLLERIEILPDYTSSVPSPLRV